MNKDEFERLIGKQVDTETFSEYEAMYMSCSLTKQEFVKRLNIKAIPEKASVVEKRESLKRDIARLEKYNEDNQWAIDCLAISPERARELEIEIRFRNLDIAYLKTSLKALEFTPKAW